MLADPKAEIEFFNDGKVIVTNARFVFNGRVYAVSKIKSLTAAYEPASVGSFNKNTILFALVLSSVTIIFLFIATFNRPSEELTGLMVCSVLVAIISAYMYTRPHVPKHQIHVHFSFLDIVSIESADQKYLENVLTALNSAIVYRG